MKVVFTPATRLVRAATARERSRPLPCGRGSDRSVGRPGFSLLELLVVMAAMIGLLLIGTAILAAAVRVRLADTAAQNHQSERNALADQFRADVRQAAAIPEVVGPWKAGPACLLLRRADGGHVVYHCKGRALERVELPGGTRRPLPIGPTSTTVEFPRPSAGLATLRLRRSARRVQDITAALGGDLR